MTVNDWISVSVGVALLCCGVLALIANRMSTDQPPTTKESHPMSLIDYRKLIDDLRDVDGVVAFATVEVLAQNAIAPSIGDDLEPDTDAVIGFDTYAAGQHFTQLRLSEQDAGALYDALGGAIRAISGPLEELPPVTSWGDTTARELVRQTAAALVNGEPDRLDDAADGLADRLTTLTRAEAIELNAALVTYAGAIVGAFAANLAEAGAVIDLEQAGA